MLQIITLYVRNELNSFDIKKMQKDLKYIKYLLVSKQKSLSLKINNHTIQVIINKV